MDPIKVPLMAYDNDKNIRVVYNGEIHNVDFPFNPYCYVRPHVHEGTTQQFINLWTKEPIDLIKKSFSSTRECQDFFRKNDILVDNKRIATMFPYLEQLAIDKEDFFMLYANTNPLKRLIFDIEVLTKKDGRFPQAEKDPIIAIGYRIDDRPIEVLCAYDETKKDYNIVLDFLKIVKEEDPDIIVSYNGTGFDIPYLIKRANANGLENETRSLCRGGALPYYEIVDKEDDDYDSKRDNNKTKLVYRLYGRIHMDIYLKVVRDQSLSGIKNNKLKTLGKWYNIPNIIEVDRGNTEELVNTDELIEYSKSDIRITDYLFEVYYSPAVALAEMMKVPLDSVINGHASYIPKIYCARPLLNNGYIAMENNLDRYGDTRFEAALVSISKTGFMEKVYKVDFSSYYPSIMMTFNLSPETVKITSMKNFNQGCQFRVISNENNVWLSIPDHNFKKQVNINIDKTKQGFVSRDLKKLFTYRKELKKKMKSDEKNALLYKSQQTAIKVIMNSIFGMMGLKYSKIGDMGVGIAIVGIARWLTNEVAKKLGDTVIEIDTDGIYVDKEINVAELDTFVTDLITKVSGFNNSIFFEKEGPWAGFFYKKKNYMLYDKDKDEILIHGVSMKTSRSSFLYDNAIMTIAKLILKNAPESEVLLYAKNLLNMQNYKLTDFLLHTKINLDDYKNEGALQVNLQKQVKEHLKGTVALGDTIDYYKIPNGYCIKERITDRNQLDMEYYIKTVGKALAVMHVDFQGQLL